MKNILYCLAIFILSSCGQNKPAKEIIASDYYDYGDTVESAGVRLNNWPDGMNRAFKHVNSEIYTMMQGPSEFGISGRLAKWDIKDRLNEIAVPTLMIGAKYDTMDPKAMEEQSKLVKNGRFLYCPNGSHLSMWDDQKVFMSGVIKFIHDVDDGEM
jgi:proline iminopeptidase